MTSYGQSGVLTLPESYIERNGIKEITYLNADSQMTSRILFTNKGLTKEHAQFIKYHHSDSIIQVHSYEYDSSNSVCCHTYLQYSIGKNEFPIINTSMYCRPFNNDSSKITRYASVYGHNIEYKESEKTVNYHVTIKDSLKETFDFYGDTLTLKKFGSPIADSIVFKNSYMVISYKYSAFKLTGIWHFMIRNEEAQLFCRIWFDTNGFPIKEYWLHNEKYRTARIEVEQWK